jgi:endonuclease YncB( thermonuclease family)
MGKQLFSRSFQMRPLKFTVFLSLILFFLSDPRPAFAASSRACPKDGKEIALVVDVTPRLELRLEDKRDLKMVGVEAPRPTPDDPDLDHKTQAQLREWLNGREIAFSRAGVESDRWGRMPAFVFVITDKVQLSVNKALLDSGLVRFEPSTEAMACRADFIEAEAGAREALFGLWSDPYYAIIEAGAPEAFADKVGSFVIVEGQVSNVESNSFRTSFYFGPRKGRDFSVAISQPHVKTIVGLHLTDFIGETLRVRGLLDSRFGLQIEISNLDELEIIVKKPIEVGLNPNVLNSRH